MTYRMYIEQSKSESLHFIQSRLYKTCTVSIYIDPTTVSASNTCTHIIHHVYVDLSRPDQPQIVRLWCFFRVVFNDVVQTNKDYMRDITVIEPDWLCELAPHFYQFGTVSIRMAWLHQTPKHTKKDKTTMFYSLEAE